MTNYSNGFFRKCAEYRVPYDVAVAMYKAATGTNCVSAAARPAPGTAPAPRRTGMNEAMDPHAKRRQQIKDAVQKYLRTNTNSVHPSADGKTP